jgi:uncharacterized protein YutE (UPF0331/DUF86 family)
MYDKIRIGIVVADIGRFFKDLEKMGVKSEKNLSDEKTFYATSMLLFSILNRLLDLGSEIITAKQLGTPGSYRDIFKLLERNKLIKTPLSKRLINLVYARNLLAHEYQDFTNKEVYKIFNEIKAVKEFVIVIKEILKSPA